MLNTNERQAKTKTNEQTVAVTASQALIAEVVRKSSYKPLKNV
jgi:hypothetical protein